MSNRALVRATSPVQPNTTRQADNSWDPGPDEVVVGKDVLELLSTSMYVDPMTIYREYVQNSADAVDDARASNLLPYDEPGRVTIHLDSTVRSIKIRDNGTGLPWKRFKDRMCNLGASDKRGSSARGFRGVGRLAGLGYCQELTFRSRSIGEATVSELRWDCRRLKSELRSLEFDGDISDLVRQVVSVRRVRTSDYPERFFEVELQGVIRHRNDRLLNPQAVSDYLVQVAPVPFAPEFQFGGDISAALAPHVGPGNLDIRINDSGQPLYRPHKEGLEIGDSEFDKYVDLEIREIPDFDGGIAAIAWILHHGYFGAIPARALVKGLRLRSGNMQVGDNSLVEDLFPEPRFNAWSVGEIHIVDRRIIPNGRRDHFEQSIHFDNLLNHLALIARDITQRCRRSSTTRKWLREFELQKACALERAETVARGGISKATRKVHIDAAAKALAAMQKVTNQRQIADEMRATLSSEFVETAGRVSKLLGGTPQAEDPLARFKPQVRAAYEHVIGLIYDCASNRAAAKSLIDKILTKLQESEPKIMGKAGCPKLHQRRR